ncbi:MAG: hypothetical protein HY879_01605 [Deltaproteobacteria bacterium]|nr:hypothetical protein [Deltaproteobacteria bacterium]
MLSNSLLESFQDLSKEFAAADKNNKNETKAEKEDPIQGMIKDARAKENQYGPEVKFVSAVPLKTETMGGFKAIYAFKDINTLRIDQNPGNKAGKLGEDKKISAKKEEVILFKFVKGPVSTLTVTMPKFKGEKEAQVPKGEVQKESQPDPKAAEMMKMFLKDMGLRIALEIDGTILKTNATYRKNSELTIVELHFGKFIENKEIFDKVNAAQPQTIEEVKELVKGIEGLKIEMTNPIVVEFK